MRAGNFSFYYTQRSLAGIKIIVKAAFYVTTTLSAGINLRESLVSFHTGARREVSQFQSRRLRFLMACKCRTRVRIYNLLLRDSRPTTRAKKH